jgi:uroporphyrinogen-III decarboxylase
MRKDNIMDHRVDFKCQGDNLEEIIGQISESLGISFPKVHENSKEMAILAMEVRKYTSNTISIVPFCTTVEAEAFGGKIKLGDRNVGPRIEGYLFSSIEELENIREIDLSKGRIKEVLDCVERLSREGEIVSLNVEGPFTIATSLIDLTTFYWGIRKDRAIVDNFLRVIEDSIERYIIEGVRRGAKIISYGDPIGALDIVGPRVYEDISGKSTYNILKSLENKLEGAIIHICGKTSTALEKMGRCEARRIEFEGQLTYGEAIMRVMEEMKDIKFIGHSCIKRTRNSLMKPTVWAIELCQARDK